MNRSYIRKSVKQSYASKITIGDVTADVIEDQAEWNVPFVFNQDNWYVNNMFQSHEVLSHLRWIMQKDLLHQDMMLLGPPGVLRRRIAYAYCSLVGREFEFVSLTGDTSESDLKQRREIKDKTAYFIDQCAVRAAIHGRIFIIEGIEKAERNILPILNNLLENREMSLEDGRFLMSAKRYDELIEKKGFTKEQLDNLNLVRVHPDFRVIALALPAPKYKGNPLDPPLRSRFQARYVSNLSVDTHLDILQNIRKESFKSIKSVLGFAQSLDIRREITEEKFKDLFTAPPEFPSTGISSMIQLLDKLPELNLRNTISRVFPYKLMNLTKDNSKTIPIIEKNMETFKIKSTGGYSDYDISRIDNEYVVNFKTKEGNVTSLPVHGGDLTLDDNEYYVETPVTKRTLKNMLIDHSSGLDICLIGSKGSGKSFIARRFAEVLGYEIETQLLYKDMNFRDLLQKRVTKENGDTVWEMSSLINGALNGRLVILDNIDRLSHNNLSSLQCLVKDRQVTLPDGSKLVPSERYQYLEEKYGAQFLLDSKIFKIHENFRILAIGNFPTKKNDYLQLESVGLFQFHIIESLSQVELAVFLKKIVPNARNELVMKLAIFSQAYSESIEFKDMPLTLRQCLRCLKKSQQVIDHGGVEEGNLHQHIHEAILSDFMPDSAKQSLFRLLEKTKISSDHERVVVPLSYKTDDLESTHLIPQIEFYPIPKHQEHLEDMSQSISSGDHILLIGNQGTGKNKLADRFLEENSIPRQYMQLHRDTTVSSLTSQPSIINGQIHWEDSPVVKAVKQGHVLVIDEADKAPVEVVTILKNLVDGEMVLSDGRRILSKDRMKFFSHSPESIVPIHPNFRMIVLANRPGYPFLGNDFFRECGDLFSVHPIDNPDVESEVQLLSSYAPDLNQEFLKKLCDVFSDLRALHLKGLITYPYSTRELVSVVKHLNKFSSDSIEYSLHNVFAYDIHNEEISSLIHETFKRHGFDLGTNFFSTAPLIEKVNQPYRVEFKSDSKKKATGPKIGKKDPHNKPHIGGNQWAGGTGGANTAGLGGKGGPFRMDSGHPVHQISDEEKKDVDEEIKKAAKAMADEELKKRLEEIKMTRYDNNEYETFLQAVQREVRQLRVILEGLEAKNRDDRIWVKNQTDGDLDEGKLVEGITGEKSVYRRRLKPPKNSEKGRSEKPKLITFVMDVSASMYRFNGVDGRLMRMLETTTMIMESFDGFDEKIKYQITGHSGDSPKIQFTTFDNPPKDRGARLKVLLEMGAYSQYCWSGDYTLAATKIAIQDMAKEEADEHFVFVLSDANFSRYGISPVQFGEILTSEQDVQAVGIFISSLFDGEAENLATRMPPGKGIVSLDQKEIPMIFKKLLSASVLNN